MNLTNQLKVVFQEWFQTILSHFFSDKIRRGSIQAVKGYVHAVRIVRMSVISVVALSAMAAAAVAGIVLMIIGLVALLPLAPLAANLMLIGFGVVLFAVPAVAYYLALGEKRWVNAAKVPELMQAVLGAPEGETLNPFEIFRDRVPTEYWMPKSMKHPKATAQAVKNAINDEIAEMNERDQAAVDASLASAVSAAAGVGGIAAPPPPVVMTPEKQSPSKGQAKAPASEPYPLADLRNAMPAH